LTTRRTIRLVLLTSGLMGAVSTASFGGPAALPCGFDHAPYVSPKIIQDLSTWESDHGDQVVAINLADSQDSNRYFGKVDVRKTRDGRDLVSVTNDPARAGEDPTIFGYEYIGKTQDNVIVLLTSSSGGGSGQFRNLMLVTLVKDHSLLVDWGKNSIKWGLERFLVKKVGEIALGDRWDGKLKVEGNTLLVGKNEGTLSDNSGDTVDGRRDNKSYEMRIVLAPNNIDTSSSSP